MRRLCMYCIGLVLIGVLVLPSVAFAVDGYEWCGQFTSTSNGGGQPYYGWHGVQGWIHWHTAPHINAPVTKDTHVDSWLSISRPDMKSPDGDLQWAQAGFTHGYVDNHTTDTGPWAYIESDGPVGYFLLAEGNRAVTPVSGHFAVQYYGVNPPGQGYNWGIQCSNNTTYWGSLGSYVGVAGASSETWNAPGTVNTLAQTYFGSDEAGYDGSTYALNLKASSGWTLWDTSLPAGGTTLGTPDIPPGTYTPNGPDFHYSPGKNYYYFGTWNN